MEEKKKANKKPVKKRTKEKGIKVNASFEQLMNLVATAPQKKKDKR
jgi:hypothetical protein